MIDFCTKRNGGTPTKRFQTKYVTRRKGAFLQHWKAKQFWKNREYVTLFATMPAKKHGLGRVLINEECFPEQKECKVCLQRNKLG